MKMKLYIYDAETAEVVQTVTGGTQEQQEQYAFDEYGTNYFAWTYSPAFGATDGLIAVEGAKFTDLSEAAR